jgi:hypothetical protein
MRWVGQKETVLGRFCKTNHKQSTRWQHLSRLKASAFFSLQKKISCYETQQLILGTGTAIWWVTEPHCNNIGQHDVHCNCNCHCNNIHHNYIQQNDLKHKDGQHNNKKRHSASQHSESGFFMLNVVMLNAIMLGVVASW